MTVSGKAPEVAGLILAGGLGSRMGYVDKSALVVHGRTILDRLLDVYTRIFPEILIAVGKPGDASRSWNLPDGVRTVLDEYPGRSSLTGIHAGLRNATLPHVFVAACDAPFLRPGLVERLVGELEPGDDVVIPRRENGRLEPLCAIYSRRCLPHIEERLGQGDFKIIRFFPKVRVREVDVEKLRVADPGLESFANVNTPGDLAVLNEK